MNPIAELARRLDNLLRPGVIVEVDNQSARCRVRSGSLVTAFLPWFAHRAGATSDWDPPTVGEQCLVISPGGELAGGFVLSGIYSQDNPPPATSSNLDRRRYPDGAQIDYDHSTHVASITLPAGGSIAIESPGGMTINGDVAITGEVTVTDDVVAAGVSLVSHRHGGVSSGSSQTGEPT